MIRAESIATMFKGQDGDTLNSIFQLVFNSELAQITGKMDMINLDECLEKQYKEYKDVSLKEFITNKWGEDFYKELIKL